MALDAPPGIQYGRRVSTLLRILCLALCLSLATAGLADAKSHDQGGKSSQQGKSGKKSGSKTKSKTKSKKSAPSETKHSGKSTGAYTGGFRSLAWGTALSEVPGLQVRERQGEAKYCVLPGDDMDFDGVQMREIVYVFCKNQLAGALMRYDGAANHLALLAKLTERHGVSMESLPNSRQDRSWRFDDGQTVIMVEYSSHGATGAVAYFAAGLFSPCEGMSAP